MFIPKSSGWWLVQFDDGFHIFPVAIYAGKKEFSNFSRFSSVLMLESRRFWDMCDGATYSGSKTEVVIN